jgi:hypothetical protein
MDFQEIFHEGMVLIKLCYRTVHWCEMCTVGNSNEPFVSVNCVIVLSTGVKCVQLVIAMNLSCL